MIEQLLMLALAATLSTAGVAAEPLSLTTPQLRDQFVQCGFELVTPNAPRTNAYIALRDPATVAVRDANQRVVMAIVFPTVDAAEAAHRKAHREAEERLGERWAYSDDHGPQLLSAYGPSVWRANVALVESDTRTLNSLYTEDIQTGDVRIARPELLELGFGSSLTHQGVDGDVVACVEAAQEPRVATVVSSSRLPEPLFLGSHPW